MTVYLLLLGVIPSCYCCNAHSVPKNRVKVVEEYVVSAKFDENNNIPQLNSKNHYNRRPQDVSLSISSRGNHRDEHLIDDLDTLEDRDLLVHHHHLPPPHPPPPPVPPPPPPAALTYGPSLFAVGLITFLILLNSLQTSLLLILKSKGSVLGSVTGALGRRRRSALDTIHGVGGKYILGNERSLGNLENL